MKPATSTPAPPSSPAASATVARRVLAAVGDRDFPRLEQLLAEDVWFRMLLPRDVIQANDAVTTMRAFYGWFGTPSRIVLLDATHHTLAGREHVRYRFRLRPQWAPDTWHLIEQAGYVRVSGGRVRRLDLVCTGFHPET